MIGINTKQFELKPNNVAANGTSSVNSINVKLNDNNNNNNNNSTTVVNDNKQPKKQESTDPTENEESTKEIDNAFIENPAVRTEQIFQKMDLDKNGVISETEFINGCLEDKFLYQMLTADYSENF